PGLDLGFFLQSTWNKRFGIKHELMLSNQQMGVQLREEVGSSYVSRLQVFHIDILPSNIRMKSGPVEFSAGPYINTLMAANLKRKHADGSFYKDRSVFGDPANDETESLYLQKFDFGMN